MNAMNRTTQAMLGTIAATVLRVATGALFMMHGWQKLQDGLPSTTNWLEALEVPYPTLAAPVLIGAELLGGAALLLGAATRFAGLVLLTQMLGAIVLVHRGQGFFVADGGWELAGLLGVVLLGFVLTGSGSVGVDRLLARRRR